jgi:6-phosphofructokinase 1
MSNDVKRMGILVGGGPAPGINSAISAAALKGLNEGWEVFGIYDGFQNLMDGRTDAVVRLEVGDVSRIHYQGGSVLRTSRGNPTQNPETLQRAVGSLRELGITRLVTIGGDDTAFGASELALAAGGALRVAHVPKTIDNDLPLPGDRNTFGYSTARQVGSRLALNLMEDSRTTNRWFFVVVMGRKAGHLALGIGNSAGATLTIIPEEFPEERIDVADVCDVLEGAILKRRAQGRADGLAVIAEGIGEKLDPESLARIPGVEVEYDSYGHIRLAEIPLETILKREIQRRFAEKGEKIAIVDLTLGYELRCAAPVPFDIDYTRTLGYGAARFLLADVQDERIQIGGLVCLGEGGRLRVLPFEDLKDPDTGRTRVRMVEIDAEPYQVARQYMLRLDPSDLEDPETLGRLATTANMTPEAFRERFENAAAVGLRREARVG